MLTGKGFQTQERLAAFGTQAGHRTPQLHHAAGVTALVNHLINAGGAQPRMLLQRLANKLDIGVDQGRTQGLRDAESLQLDGVAHGFRMKAQFLGDGADFPMLGVIIAADLRARFGTES